MERHARDWTPRMLVLAAGAACCSGVLATDETDRPYRDLLLEDAATRPGTSLVDVGAGPGGFTISDAAGEHSLTIEGQLQGRFHLNFRADPPTAGDPVTTTGFEMRRTKLWFSGNIASQDFGYHIEIMNDFGAGTLMLGDAVGWWAIDNEWDMTFGQFKTPFLRESIVDSRYLLAHERSVTEHAFSMGRTRGVALNYAGDDFRFTGAFSNGGNTENVPFNDDTVANFALTARGEWKPWGEWEAFRDQTSFPGRDLALMVGGAVHHQDEGDPGEFTIDVNIKGLTTDVSVEGDGWNAFASATWMSVDPTVVDPIEFFGIVLQGGAFISGQDELFARWDVVIADDSVNDDFHTITLGWTRYIIPDSHALKFTAGVQVFDDVSATTLFMPNTGLGLLPDADGPQADLFAQMQGLF